MIIKINNKITIPPIIIMIVVELNSVQWFVMEGLYFVLIGTVIQCSVTVLGEDLLVIGVLDLVCPVKFLLGEDLLLIGVLDLAGTVESSLLQP